MAYVYQDYNVEEEGTFQKDWTYYLPALLPKHKVKLLARYNVWEGAWFLLSSRYVGERDAQKGAKLDDYITVDLGFMQTFKWNNQKVTAEAYLNNATGTDYQEQAGFPMPEYVWGFRLGVRF